MCINSENRLNIKEYSKIYLIEEVSYVNSIIYLKNFSLNIFKVRWRKILILSFEQNLYKIEFKEVFSCGDTFWLIEKHFGESYII